MYIYTKRMGQSQIKFRYTIKTCKKNHNIFDKKILLFSIAYLFLRFLQIRFQPRHILYNLHNI